jgi:hypothetical protein
MLGPHHSLFSNLAAAESRISPLHLDNRINELFGRTFGSGAPTPFKAVEQAILAPHQGVMKVQKGGRFQYHSHLAQAFG